MSVDESCRVFGNSGERERERCWQFKKKVLVYGEGFS